MPETLQLTRKRQHELQVINRILAILVVILSFSTGFLLVLREQLLIQSTPNLQQEQLIVSNPEEIHPIPTASTSALVNISKQARYHRTLLADPITLADLQKILWLAQGKITDWGERTVPSYKSLFPIELYVYIRKVNGIDSGMYHYDAKSQQLKPISTIASVKFPDQLPSAHIAPVLIFAVNNRPSESMSHIESGGISQQILLAAIDSKLAAYLIPSTAFSNTSLHSILNPDKELEWIMPIGRPNPDIN